MLPHQSTFSRALFCATFALACAGCAAPARTGDTAPHYVLDTAWPQPLPNQWVVGGLGGVCVDHADHVIILNRQNLAPGDLNGGRMAPPVIEFDPSGKVLAGWGDMKNMDARLHSCHEDAEGNLWVASGPSGMIQKYTHDGARLLLQIGKRGVYDTSDGTQHGKPLNSPAGRFTSPSSIAVDRGNGDVYVSDGEDYVLGGEPEPQDKRVIVFDRDGKFLRQWLLPHMQSVHCMALSRAGEVYVCNRTGSQVEIYDRQGKLLRTLATPWTPVTPPADGKPQETGGSAVAIDFSPDPAQKWIFVINQNNARIDIYERASGKWLNSFGRPGTGIGEFNQVHGIAVDSHWNVYLAENRGRRLMRYVLQP